MNDRAPDDCRRPLPSGGPRWRAHLPWLGAALLLLVTLGAPSVRRTQEARVLETARQMLGTGVRGWAVPHLNDHLRLQKPPLAYWLSAASFGTFGVGEWAGRLPFAFAACLTAAVVYRFGAELYGRRAAALAAAAWLGCGITARFGRLAETDVLATLFVTAAAYANWRGLTADAGTVGRRGGPTRSGTMPRAGWRGAAWWFHVGAAATGLAVLAKGPPAAFPLLASSGWALALGRRDRLVLWVRRGAPLTLLIVALPWFAYIVATVEYKTLLNELRMVAVGGGHRGTFLNYFAYLPVALLPWTGFAAAGVWLAVRRCRRDRRLAVPLVWVVVSLAPLCAVGQKQPHYLLPLVPPLALLAGWYADRATRGRTASRLRAGGAANVAVPAVALVAVGIALPFAGQSLRGHFAWQDAAAGALVAAAGGWAALVVRRGGPARGVWAAAAAAAAVPVVLTGWWLPTVDEASPRAVAAAIRQRYGADRPLYFDREGNLPLQFSLRSRVPRAATADRLSDVLAADPRTVVIAEDPVGENPPAPAAGLVLDLTFRDDDKVVRVYSVGPSAPAGSGRGGR